MTTFAKTAIAAALFVATSANAGVYNLAANNAGSDGFHGVFTVDSSTGSFNDLFRFNLDSVANFGAYASSFDVTFTEISIDGVIFGSTAVNPVGSISHAIAAVGANGLAAGTHNVRIKGTGVAGDQYTLDMAPMSAVSPVSEPSTLGLMFGGIALVGMIAYRSRKA